MTTRSAGGQSTPLFERRFGERVAKRYSSWTAFASERSQQLYGTEYEERFREIYAEHGVDYDDLDAVEEWDDHEVEASELERLGEQLGEEEDRLREEVYREFGETEMADLWASDRARFKERWRRGQELAHPGLRGRMKKMVRGEIDPDDLFK